MSKLYKIANPQQPSTSAAAENVSVTCDTDWDKCCDISLVTCHLKKTTKRVTSHWWSASISCKFKTQHRWSRLHVSCRSIGGLEKIMACHIFLIHGCTAHGDEEQMLRHCDPFLYQIPHRRRISLCSVTSIFNSTVKSILLTYARISSGTIHWWRPFAARSSLVSLHCTACSCIWHYIYGGFREDFSQPWNHVFEIMQAIYLLQSEQETWGETWLGRRLVPAPTEPALLNLQKRRHSTHLSQFVSLVANTIPAVAGNAGYCGLGLCAICTLCSLLNTIYLQAKYKKNVHCHSV